MSSLKSEGQVSLLIYFLVYRILSELGAVIMVKVVLGYVLALELLPMLGVGWTELEVIRGQKMSLGCERNQYKDWWARV
jgi:hypothetical protein